MANTQQTELNKQRVRSAWIFGTHARCFADGRRLAVGTGRFGSA